MSNTSNEVLPQRNRPRFGKIGVALEYSGLRRTKMYQLAGTNPGLFKKCGRSTLVDIDALDEVLNRLPAATIKQRSPDRDE